MRSEINPVRSDGKVKVGVKLSDGEVNEKVRWLCGGPGVIEAF